MSLGRSVPIAAILLLVPLAAAQALDVDAGWLEAEDAQLDGRAAVVHAAQAEGTRMTLEAQRVRVEEYTETTGPPHSVVGTGEGIEPGHREADHRAVHWTGRVDGGGYVLVEAASGEARLTVSAPSMQVALPTVEREEAGVMPSAAGADRSGYRPAVAGTTSARAGAVHVELHGDFTLRLWSATVGGSTADGEATHEAGAFEDERDPVPRNAALRWTTDVFVTVRVENGTLSLRTPSTALVHAYLDGTGFLEGQRGTLYGAVGRVAGDAVSGTVVLESFSLRTEPTGDGLRVWSTPSREPSLFSEAVAAPAASIPLLALAVAAVVALALLARARRPSTVQMLLDRMDSKRYRSVVRHAPRVLRRTRSEAVAVMRAVAFMALGRPAEALRFLESLPPGLRPTDGMDPFLRAHALNESGRSEEARRLLDVALGQNPGLVAELRGLPRLRALLPDDAPPEAYT